MAPPTGALLLCADDYAMTEGISRGIEELAAAGRLSATSAMTGTPHWPSHGKRLRDHRDGIAIGLHFNLTLGAPMGPLPRLAPSGRLPTAGDLVRRALTGDIDEGEIEAEMLRQLDAFEAALGAPPDFIDGHQHVHALPRVRRGVLSALRRRYSGRPLLIRNPADRPARIARRAVAVPKALVLSALSAGFAAAVRTAGFLSNDGFAGVSTFAAGASAAEFARFAEVEGGFPIVMCHPGHVDAELASLDPLTARREEELSVLRYGSPFADRLWRPRRTSGGVIDWPVVETTA